MYPFLKSYRVKPILFGKNIGKLELGAGAVLFFAFGFIGITFLNELGTVCMMVLALGLMFYFASPSLKNLKRTRIEQLKVHLIFMLSPKNITQEGVRTHEFENWRYRKQAPRRNKNHSKKSILSNAINLIKRCQPQG